MAGDVLEIEDGHFRSVRVVEVLGGLGRGEENVKVGRHTAVVVGVVRSGRGGGGAGEEVVEVVEQNAKVRGVVAEGEYNLREMVEGVVKVYRPVGKSQLRDGGLERAKGHLRENWLISQCRKTKHDINDPSTRK
ncbi:hypothetical protein EMPG_17396 [Blastomyces silverae]|uniref:BBC1/AIM3 cysteine proteinase-fold domain-containing protein n=1 Tax=Blastomyces silverae TaxID=2060906 RepID=A0A0H1B6U0_9EURO|nr:hypothetical protein EMPG_17396 [Blastomyces silverae]